MAGSTPVPFEGVSVLFYFSGNGYSSARIVHLTGEHFGIITNLTQNLKKNPNPIENKIFFFFFLVIPMIQGKFHKTSNSSYQNNTIA